MAAPFRRALRCSRSPAASLVFSSLALASKWRLFGALCLQRLPRVTQAMSPQEKEMAKMVQQNEVEKSLYSDHEIRCLAEEERLRRRKDKYDDDDDDTGKEIVLPKI